MKSEVIEDWQVVGISFSVRHSTQVLGSLLPNIGRKGDFMYSCVWADYVRWRALAMQVSREPLWKYGERVGGRCTRGG
jgi:hypothetical protein